MRFNIEKRPDGTVQIEVVPKGSKRGTKPVAIDLTVDQLRAVMRICETAIGADSFRMSYETVS